MLDLPPVVAIVGPTAVGKSQLALALAPEFGASIVSADSRQVYRYMDIGTAKPSLRERAEVPHFMLDLIEPSQTYSAQLFREEGTRALKRLAAAGHPAFVVGGTGFYLRALLGGVSLPSVPPNPELRQRLVAEAERTGPASLHARLAAADPASARRIHPHNLPRVIRALEIIEQLGGPVPAAEPSAGAPALYLGLCMERSELDDRADRRVLDQIEAGLVEETRLLLEMGYSPDLPALQGFAYRQMVAHLNGDLSLDAAIADYQAATRQYIRRQLTWFRKQAGIEWIGAGEAAKETARQRIASWLAGEER